ncbi:MAG: DUF362 domain-containing protein [Ignavibacteria bacterium]|nr:DUF362 domain-containing protein [Ignavibacteria bacterium]
MAKSKVSVLKTKPDSVLSDIHHLMKLADVSSFLSKDATTILKDNISWHFPYLSANTTPWQMEGVIQSLRSEGFNDLVSVHNNTVVTDPYRGEKLNKLSQLYKKYGIEEKYNFLPEQIKWIEWKPKAKMHTLYKIYPEGIFIPEYFIEKNIVHLPTVKTHIYTTTTGAMKNAFGGLLNTRRHYTHTWIHETLVDLLAIQKEIHSGIFAVMDGTICGSGPGPRTMIPVEKDYILASADQVAIDAIAAKMMGFDPMSIKYIRLAHESGLGIGNPRDIEIVGENISNVNFQFTEVGDNLASMAGDFIWFGPLKKLQWLFFHTPLVYIFVFGSYAYHDYFWWPFKGKKIQRDLLKESKWAKLFEKY